MKKLMTLMIAGIAVVSLVACENGNSTYEVVYIHRTEESAKIMADNFNLEMVSYSDYGVTTYSTKSIKQYESLLATMGFADNNTYETAEGAGTNDFYAADQWSIPNMGVDLAWNISTGYGVTVAVVDTGVDIDHPDLVSSMSTTGYNAATMEVGLDYADDDSGHGTRVAGIIAADKDNEIGIAGIAPDITIVPIKVNYAGTSSIKASWAIDGILFAIDQGVDVINLSYGSTTYNALMEQVIDQAVAAGIVVVAAAGNSGTEKYYYPASYDNAISVGSIDEDSTISGFSTFNHQVDLSAPGADLPTTAMGNDYVNVNGTSFASPAVAASAALLLSVYPDLTPAEVREKLQSTAIDAGETGLDKYYGHGIVNVYDALASDMATVSFNTDGGTVIETARVIPGETLTLADEPLKLHHQFVGWYTDSSFTTEWINGSVVNNSMILYAKFTPVDYVVNFYNGDTLVFTESVTYGSLITAPELTREGYSFSGWYTYTNELYDLNSTPVDDINLYARWTVNIYSVVYQDKDGNVVEQFNFEYGADTTHTAPEGPAKEYYDFIGWIGVIPNTMPAGNIIITPAYAKRIGVVYVTLQITIVYEDGTEEVITIEVPQNQVDDIIAQYGNGVIIG